MTIVSSDLDTLSKVVFLEDTEYGRALLQPNFPLGREIVPLVDTKVMAYYNYRVPATPM